MVKSMNELIKNRKNFLEVAAKNNMTGGIKALLTDLYPDSAHFIYELLQNAEDMNASEVRFRLENDCLYFEHNGTKRDFNLDDIDAITSIGNNVQKKDDVTSIGKFGVGFKAVFAYTSTPVIHSGNYHFMIEDYFLPKSDGVEKVNTKDKYGVKWTKFEFPFNNPKKSKNDAHSQIEEGLRALDYTSIIFLRNINSIYYKLSSIHEGKISKTKSNDFTVIATYLNNRLQKKSEWLIFNENISLVDEQGNDKNLSIGLAYSVGQDPRTGKKIIQPVNYGRTFIYFPAEKEYSKLKFHINAPFASTVARDSIRSCKDNELLMTKLAVLMKKTFIKIKELNLMNAEFYQVLPTDRDQLHNYYSIFIKALKEAFSENAYLLSKENKYYKSNEVILGYATINSLIDEEKLKLLTGIDKKWITRPLRNVGPDFLYQTLNLDSFSYEDFLNLFKPIVKNKLIELLKKMDDRWIRDFYLACDKACSEVLAFTKTNMVHYMKNTTMIRGNDNELYYPTDIYILPKNTRVLNGSTPIVKQYFTQTNEQNKASGQIRDFFTNVLNIKEYGEKVEIEKMLKRYSENGIVPNSNYFDNMLVFADYANRFSDIDFSSYPIFIGKMTGKNNTLGKLGKQIFFGDKYGYVGGDKLAEVLKKDRLWTGYLKNYNVTQLKIFKSFAEHCGVKTRLQIVKTTVKFNQNYHLLLATSGKETKYCVDEDFTITSLQDLLELKSYEVNLIIWQTLLHYGKDCKNSFELAKYSPNSSTSIKTCDSKLICILKNTQWLPDRVQNLYKPEDITLEKLHPTFNYEKNNNLLNALNIGLNSDKQAKEMLNLEKQANNLGMIVIPKEYQEQFLLYLSKEKKKNEKTLKSSKELFDDENRKQKNNESEVIIDSGKVANIERRERKIEEQFKNRSKMKPVIRLAFSTVQTSTKEEKETLDSWYNGHCQICGTRIVSYQNKNIFVAKNIINTKNLPSTLKLNDDLCWNSVCLCPNCSAKYNYCSKDISSLYKQIMSNRVIYKDTKKITLEFELSNEKIFITYNTKHFLALRKILALIDEENMLDYDN